MSSMPPHLSHPKYRPDIDGLRAIAVLSVVAFHAFPGFLKGGFVGVDVFFVISGFLISTIIFESLDKGTFRFSEFYARRIKRIFPALLLVLIASFAFGWFVLLGNEYKQLGKHIAAGAGFASNLMLWSEAGYFDNSAQTKPLLHLWSLGIEEQFYIVWPLLLWIAWKRKFNLLTITIIIALASFYLNVKGVKKDAVATFYSPQTRFWELMCGSLLAWISIYKKGACAGFKEKLDGWSGAIYKQTPEANGKTLANVISFVGFFLLAYGFWHINKEFSFPGKWALVPILGTVLLISAGPMAWLNRTILSNRIVVWFGLISYPLYLWHWPLLSFARIIEGEVPGRNIRIAAVLLSVSLAWLTYILVERRVRSGQHSKIKVATLVVLMVAVGYVGYYTYSKDGLELRTNIKEMKLVDAQFVGPLWEYTKNDLCLEKFPYKDAEKFSHWFCMISDERNPTIILLGNSFANQLYPGFANNPFLKHHTILSIGACDFTGINKNINPSGPCYRNRTSKQEIFINKLISQNKSIKYAVIDGLYRAPSPHYIYKLRKRISFLEENQIQVILFNPHLLPDYHPKACFKSRPFKKAKDCSFPASKIYSLNEKFEPIEKAIHKSHPNVLFFDQNSIYCDELNCSYVRDGMPLHRDKTHISEFASNLLQSYFTEWADKNVPEIFDSN